MQDTILKLCKQIHTLLPTKRIAITRFVGKYEYGQIYVGELDREAKREPCNYAFYKRNFCVIYSQDPAKDQETARQDFELVCTTLQDNCPFLYDPRWYKTFFDVFETTLILEFQVWERYERKPAVPDVVMDGIELEYPSVIYDGDEPTPTPPGPEPPPTPPTPVVPDFDKMGITGVMRVWGDEVSTGTEMTESSFGNFTEGQISFSTLPYSEPMSLPLAIPMGGIMSDV